MGTPPIAIKAREGLVTISKIMPPKKSKIFLSATDTLDPITVCNKVVSVVTLKNRGVIYIYSNNAIYNKLTHDTFFFNNGQPLQL